MDFSHDQRFNAHKASGMGVVALAHIILGGALVFCLQNTTRPIDKGPVVFKPLPPPLIEKPLDPPPTTAPRPKLVDIFVPAPEKPVAPQPEPPVITDVTTIPPEPGTKPRIPGGGETGGGGSGIGSTVVHSSSPIIANLNECKPPYPSAAVKEEEEGTVRLKLDIGANGQLLGASVLQTSGHPDLDRAAVKGLSRCSFKAAMQDGAPVQSSLVTDYIWSLER